MAEFVTGIDYEKSSRKQIIRQNRAMASTRANPSIAYAKSCCFILGFRLYPRISAPKTIPIPVPTPASPSVAIPAPMILALCCGMLDVAGGSVASCISDHGCI